MSDDPITPSVMYLLFERGLFLGAFTTRDAAERLRSGREAVGRPKAKLVKFLAVPDPLADPSISSI